MLQRLDALQLEHGADRSLSADRSLGADRSLSADRSLGIEL
jgi:hypothetical protein